MTGRLWLPTTGGQRPVVLVLHGRHSACYGGTSAASGWPCALNASYLGYEGTLASQGYEVISISANAINVNDNQLAADYGAKARGQLVLALAPVDFGRATVGDVDFLTILPYCDGDVSNQQGQHIYDDSRHAFDDDVLRSTVWLMGANHNFFNTIWTPGLFAAGGTDDWGATSTDSVCGPQSSTNIRLSSTEEYDVGTGYMSAWFRLTLGGDDQFLPLFSDSNPVLPSVPTADVRAITQTPGSARVDINTFTEFSTAVTVSGGAVAAVCENWTGRTTPQPYPYCSTSRTASAAVPHWAPMRFGSDVPAATGADATASGGLYLSDLAFQRNVLGIPGSLSTLPTLATRHANVEEGDGVTETQLAVVLDRPTDKVVTGYTTLYSVAGGNSTNALAKVTFQPGETCQVVTFNRYADESEGASPTTTWWSSTTNVTNAVKGTDGFGTLTVREDDGTPTTTPFGLAGDACAEYSALSHPGTVTVSTTDLVPGASFDLTATGYRSGEGVAVSLGDLDLGTVVADSSGSVALTATVPEQFPLGLTTVTAVGAGSGYTSATPAEVLQETSITLSASSTARYLGSGVYRAVSSDPVAIVGRAATTTTSLRVGAHTIKAVYLGNETTEAASSALIRISVVKAYPAGPPSGETRPESCEHELNPLIVSDRSRGVHLEPACGPFRPPTVHSVAGIHRRPWNITKDGSRVKLSRSPRLGAIAAISVLALSLAACGGSSDSGKSTAPTTSGAGSAAADLSSLSGTLAGSGASSQEKAVEGWIAGFNDSASGVTVTYDPQGSGAGREQFLSGAVQFAGSDAALSTEELSSASTRCFGGEALELPVYISPIAVVYNLPGVTAEHLQMSAATVAKIFDGKITTWNDPAIAADNSGVTLPDTAIIPVHRSDESGTTENFTDYLSQASGGAWTYPASGDWPVSGGQSGAKTQGVVDTVSGAEGAIGYVDASRAGDLGTVAIQVGDAFVPYSAEAAAKVVDASPAAADATSNRLVIEIDRTTTAAGTYPLVLVSYDIACSKYDKQADVDNVKAYLTYVASAEGQARSADASVAGSAPISDTLRAKVQAAIDAITLAS